MKLLDIEFKNLEIPFRVSFKHASAERTKTETVIAVAYMDNGLKGYGEGCPRKYVTGENIQSCFDFLQQNKLAILEINDIDGLWKFIEINQDIIDKNPAAWCAIETSVLDLLGKYRKQSLENLIGLAEVEGTFRYTAVLGVASHKTFLGQLEQYIQLGFKDFKVKISGDIALDNCNLSAIYKKQSNARVRLDANNLWDDSDAAIAYLSSLSSKFWAIEEPLRVGDSVGQKSLENKLDCKIILDESFLGIEQLPNLENNHTHLIPNIRISKMGGLLRSMYIAEECRIRNIKFIIGAQVGETSILTRLAISLANIYPDNLLAQEGAYSTYLLEHDIFDPPIQFGQGGLLNYSSKNTVGLGLGK